MKKIFLIAIITSMTILAGCASVPMVSAEKDLQTKQFSPVPGKSSIYIFRNGNVIGQAIKTTITLNDKVVGKTAIRTYLNVVTNPGQQKISCLSEVNKSILLNTKPDQLYFVSQGMRMGVFKARCNIREVSALEGMQAVSVYHMAQSKWTDEK